MSDNVIIAIIGGITAVLSIKEIQRLEWLNNNGIIIF